MELSGTNLKDLHNYRHFRDFFNKKKISLVSPFMKNQKKENYLKLFTIIKKLNHEFNLKKAAKPSSQKSKRLRSESQTTVEITYNFKDNKTILVEFKVAQFNAFFRIFDFDTLGFFFYYRDCFERRFKTKNQESKKFISREGSLEAQITLQYSSPL